MTNIANLPQIVAAFEVTVNSDWRDTIQFQWAPGTDKAGQPIYLAGIEFYSQVRDENDSESVLLDMSTKNGLLTKNDNLGTLSFSVPRDGDSPSAMSKLKANTTPNVDIIAVGDGMIINLMQVSGPATVTVTTGITSFTP